MRIICGVDVAKARLDVCIEPGGIFACFDNDAAGIAALAGFCPAIAKPPPTNNPVAQGLTARTPPSVPEPNADQLLPSHLAMFAAGIPPAVSNTPPAYKSVPRAARANTTDTNGPPLTPVPSADQALPFQEGIAAVGLD